MDDDKIEDVGKGKEADCGCGSGCCSGGLSARVKTIVCLVILIAAAIVLGHRFLKKSTDSENVFVTTIPVSKTVESPFLKEPSKESVQKQDKVKLWGDPLDSLASLNKVEANLDAVFIFISGKGDEKDTDIKKEIENAAGKFQAGGSSITAYMLVKVSKDYAQITGQVPAPCVLAMVKGKGMSVVSNDITEAKLLEALVTASRPSSCGPSGCGPSSAGCP